MPFPLDPNAILPIPSCSGWAPELQLSVGVYLPFCSITSSTKVTTYIDSSNNLHQLQTVKLAINALNNTPIKNINTTKDTIQNNLFGFNLKIPALNVDLPGYTIPKWPRINNGCDDCETDYWIPTCDFHSC